MSEKKTKKDKKNEEKESTPENKSKNKTGKKQTKKDNTASFYLWIAAIAVIAVLVYLGIREIYKNQQVSPTDIILNNIDTDTAYNYNGYPFIKNGDIWTTQIEVNGQLYNIERQYGPREVENINISYLPNNFADMLKSKRRVYFAVDPEDDNPHYLGIVGASLILSLRQVYGVKVDPSCTSGNTACVDKPIVTCENATRYPIVTLIHDEPMKIEYSGQCLLIQGTGEDLVKAGDRVIYGWYGIMK